MLQVDKAKAVEMFQAISFPQLHELHCEEALVDHVSEYYDLLGLIVATALTPKDVRDGRHVELLNSRIGGMNSPVQVAPMAKVLSSAALSPEELKALTGSYAAALERTGNDDRSFSASLSDTDQELQQFVGLLRARAVAPDAVIGAYRGYLVRNFTGNRCGDNVGRDLLPTVAGSFNRRLASDANPNLAPLVADDLKPAKIEGKADLEPFFDEAEFQQGFQGFLDLLVGKEHRLGKAKPLTDEQKDTTEWREQFDDFLRKVDELKAGTGEPEYRFFYRKATALQALLKAAPPGPDQDKVVRKFVGFIASSNFQQDNLLEWYAQMARTADAIKGMKAGTYAKFLQELEGSGNPVLVLYAAAVSVL
jgi:hypothetical protein